MGATESEGQGLQVRQLLVVMVVRMENLDQVHPVVPVEVDLVDRRLDHSCRFHRLLVAFARTDSRGCWVLRMPESAL